MSTETFQPNKNRLNFQITSAGWMRIFTDSWCKAHLSSGLHTLSVTVKAKPVIVNYGKRIKRSDLCYVTIKTKLSYKKHNVWTVSPPRSGLYQHQRSLQKNFLDQEQCRRWVMTLYYPYWATWCLGHVLMFGATWCLSFVLPFFWMDLPTARHISQRVVEL